MRMNRIDIDKYMSDEAFDPIDECREYLKGLLQHAKENYVEEFTASTPKEYWAHNKVRQDQVQYIINQLD